MSDKINIVRDAIVDDLGKRRKSGDKSVIPMDPEDSHRWYHPQKNFFAGDGVIDCPTMCGGKVKYSRSPYNGHVSARCSTAGCVAWME